ncbi:MAG: DinB family protein [Agriterribacter sp.]
MDTKTASTRTEGLVALFDLHTTLFERALEGIPDKDMHKRLDTKANHMAWLAGAAVAQRFQMAADEDRDLKQTGAELFKNNKGIQEGVTYPTGAEYLADWKKVTPAARKALVKIDDKQLDSEFDMEGMKMTWMELVTFTKFREASIIGQLALWRRLLGHPAMRYD